MQLNQSTQIYPLVPFRSAGHWLLAATLLCIPAVTWLSVTGNPLGDLYNELPPGQLLYRFSKLAGLYAVMLLWMQVMYGLLKTLPRVQGILPIWSVSLHRGLGLSVLVLALLHFGLFVIAVSLRKQAVAWNLFLPDFSQGFYTSVVSVGWCALLVLLIVAIVGLLRNKLSGPWLKLHRLALLVLWAGMVHGLLIGTDTSTGLWKGVLMFCVATSAAACIGRWMQRT